MDELKPFLNVASEESWRLLVAWLLSGIWPHGPYPVLGLYGEQGSAKSTATRVLRGLVDPSAVPLRADPRDARDLAVACTHCRVLAFDNLSRIPSWLSDALCRLATGGGFATRQLFTDQDEVFFDGRRPVIINGISELATRSDLLDRSLIVELPPIPENMRRTEHEFWGAFEAARPRILASLLTCCAGALRNFDSVELKDVPRMADFAQMVTAAEPAIGWSAGSFLRAYRGNRESANALALESSPVTPFIQNLLKGCNEWKGTAQALYEELTGRAIDITRNQQGWPKNGQALSRALKGLAPNFRRVGINVEFGVETADGTKRRYIALCTRPENCVQRVPSVRQTSSKDKKTTGNCVPERVPNSENASLDLDFAGTQDA